MIILHTIAELRAWRAAQDKIAFVPTMGNLHAGHLALVELAGQHAAGVLVSIFVNPLQFGVNEDYAQYPRTLPQDSELLSGSAASAIFAPTVETLFPVPQSYHIEPPPLADELCGQFRPGHFRGVATVVMKLINLTQPDIAVFGKKDFQQLTILRGMVQDFALPVNIIAAETCRAEDGLALSSRNGYLTTEQRQAAAFLYASLGKIKTQILNGERNYPQLEQAAHAQLNAAGWRVDYVSIRNQSLAIPTAANKQLVILAAAYLGRTRLIDNIEVLI